MCAGAQHGPGAGSHHLQALPEEDETAANENSSAGTAQTSLGMRQGTAVSVAACP